MGPKQKQKLIVSELQNSGKKILIFYLYKKTHPDLSFRTIGIEPTRYGNQAHNTEDFGSDCN